MAKKKISRITPSNDETAVFFGITSTENDYRVSWEINNSFGLFMTKQNDYIQTNKDNKPSNFSLFACEQKDTRYFLISNKGEKTYLLNEQKNLDFILIIVGSISQDSMNKFATLSTLSQIISGVFRLPDQLNKKIAIPYL